MIRLLLSLLVMLVLSTTSYSVEVGPGYGTGDSLPDQSGETGKFLTTDGTDASWGVPAGSGNVAKVGTPVNDQVGVWTGDGTLEGDADLTFDGTNLSVGNNIVVGGTVDGIDIATDVAANTSKETNATHSGDVTGDTALTIATDAVDIAMLSATGTADGTTYLRGDNTWATPAGSGDALTTNPLSQFAATTSAQFAGVISDETGTGVTVLATSPALVTPDLGVPTAIDISNATGTLGSIDIQLGATTTANTGSIAYSTTNNTLLVYEGGDIVFSDDVSNAASYAALVGATFTGEVVLDDLGTEYVAGDTLTDCTTFGATNGGIFFDDSEGKFKKCQDNVLTDLDTSSAGNADDAVEFVIDGGGSAITTGIKGDLELPWSATINRATMLCDQSGSIVVDVWVDTYANYPPTDADSITASAPPTVTADTDSQDTTLTGWTTSITAGQIVRFNVDSASTVERCTISLKVTK